MELPGWWLASRFDVSRPSRRCAAPPYASGTSTQDRLPALSITFSKIVIMRFPSAKVGYSPGAAGLATRA